MLFTSAFAPEQVVRHRTPTSAGRSRPVKAKSGKQLLGLVERLRSHGAKVTLTNEKISQPFFLPPGHIINVNDEGVQVFEYGQVSLADTDAKRVSPDGMTVGTSKPSWMAPPHFFKSGRLIVLYVGNEQTVLRILRATIGKQFAGDE